MTKRTFFIALVVLTLPLGLLGCANEVDDGERSDTVLRIDAITPVQVESDIDQPLPSSDLVLVQLSGIPRGGAADSPFNDVVLERYRVTYRPPVQLLAGGSIQSSGFVDIDVLVPAAGTGDFTAVAVPVTLKDQGLAGGFHNASIHVRVATPWVTLSTPVATSAS